MTAALAQAALDAREFIPPLDPFGIPAPAWVFQALLLVTMHLHLVFMNFALGGPILAGVLDALTCFRRGNHNPTVRLIWQALPVAVSLTITTGVAPLLFVQVLFGSFFYTSNVFLGFVWLAIVPLMLAGFYLVYAVSYRMSNALSGRVGAWNHTPGRRLAWTAIAALLFVAVAWILTNNHMLSVQPQLWPEGGEWRQNRAAVSPAITLPRFFHNLGGALLMTGLWVACIGAWRRWRGVDPPELADATLRIGLRTYAAMLAAMIVLGPTLLLVLPGDVRGGLLRPTALSVLWWLALLLIVVQAALAYAALRRRDQSGWIVALAVVTLISLAGMLAGREQVRLEYLARDGVGFSLSHWPVRTQTSSLVAFLVSLAAAIVTVIWLVAISVRAPRTPAGK